MKLPESAAFRLFDKYGILHPKIGVSSGKVVIKADLAIGGKKKAGLVRFCAASEVDKVSKEMGVPVIVEEFIPHEREFFVAIRAEREGLRIYFSDRGGIEVEQEWESVKSFLVTEDRVLSLDWPSEQLADLVQPSMVLSFLEKILNLFFWEDATYIEINPLTITKEYKVMPLGVVMEVDEAAGFRHPDWSTRLPDYQTTGKTERERIVADVDETIRGSIKLVEIPGGDTAMMAGGAGAALFLGDAITREKFKLASYAEFSGNPPQFAVAELVKQTCAIPGIKNLVIGSGIANFTDVVSNFRGIIQGLSESPEAKNLNIVVQRLGPGEEEGMDLMRQFIKKSHYQIRVFGRELATTEVVARLKD